MEMQVQLPVYLFSSNPTISALNLPGDDVHLVFTSCRWLQTSQHPDASDVKTWPYAKGLRHFGRPCILAPSGLSRKRKKALVCVVMSSPPLCKCPEWPTPEKAGPDPGDRGDPWTIWRRQEKASHLFSPSLNVPGPFILFCDKL